MTPRVSWACSKGAEGGGSARAGSRGDGLADELAALMAQQSWLQDAAGQAATSAIQGCVCASRSLLHSHCAPMGALHNILPDVESSMCPWKSCNWASSRLH